MSCQECYSCPAEGSTPTKYEALLILVRLKAD